MVTAVHAYEIKYNRDREGQRQRGEVAKIANEINLTSCSDVLWLFSVKLQSTLKIYGGK